MLPNPFFDWPPERGPFTQSGFTLVELLIAMVVALVAIGAIYSVYICQLHSYRNEQLTSQAQQNLRGAMVILEQEIRMAGYDPENTGQFGIVDVRRYDLIDRNALNLEGQPILSYTLDMDENGDLDDRSGGHNREHPNFRMRNDRSKGRVYLSWNTGTSWQPLAENIQAIGFAFAVDMDDDGRPDTWSDGPHLIWAVDSDNDNLLDTHLDTNDDGRIDTADDADGDLRLTGADGAALNPPVPLDRIKIVRVWLLSVSSQPLKGHLDSRSYVVGDRVIKAAPDGFAHQLLETVIEGRNL